MTAVGTIQLVIPMAGLGSRFSEAGYATPKPLLPIHGEPMFKVVMANLLTEQVGSVTIVAQQEWELGAAIAAIARQIPQTVDLIEIDYITAGPAETVELARPSLDPSLPVVTGNSDQYVDVVLQDFYNQLLEDSIAGNILTMEDDDPKWSYASVGADGAVTEVKEKEVISPLATVGVYGFASAELMFEAFDEMRSNDDTVNGELYVAPAYNRLIRHGLRVVPWNLGPVSRVMFGLGIPVDYENFLQSETSQRAVAKARALTL